MPTKKIKKQSKNEPLAEALAGTISVVANEPFVLNALEPFFSPKPAKLGAGEDVKELQRRVDRLVESLGGPPKLVIRTMGDEAAEKVDFYPAAAIAEVVNMFHRVRRSVCRAHMSYIGSSLIRQDPSVITNSEEVTPEFCDVLDNFFWEHAETAYIRLASYWDRVGQLLDFVFFGIRQYERDGFSAVIDRIAGNQICRHRELKESRSWKAVSAFHRSESADGAKWLLRRRNLIVHSVYLRPLTDPENSSLFESEFNHLDEKLRKKLCPGKPKEEIERICGQLEKAALLFPEVLDLCEQAVQLKRS